ncbi:hypothetical protein [Campylobacter hyointestinalis]|uniref:Uncharacterized protein n=1 Tax=Campylobacter hyointestinalis TaxID=198 RepID=A0A562XLM7_CAMHY|nr:hypothetical protein [Campylobacter hyointestinalis]RAZ26047.1 hypothetical protein CHL9752_01245 [Campylobacter hyointestinalis subsp. lawsonii]RAZ39769.1 hypothetical protein CHL9426_02235 [Campylobacter hyointestinalis subsp. lawsonii]RAZ57025.1 hypothetical protein CHL10074_01795 [Campylobacter hyointestinalis subsp. lawsonii]RAZ65139.1 hypothetical protein CHL9767_01220 [Campylobacter hyointestinalis subsp. lawsonii]TWO23044.1 hypothetical protein YZ82_00440 [Campylobacter hyointestina
MKYTMQDKARILRITTRTLQRWRTTKPELYAIIESAFKLRELANSEFELSKEIKQTLLEHIPPS